VSNRQQRRKTRRRRSSSRVIGVGAGTLALTLVPAAAAQAKTIKVTNLHNSGSGSLREAISKADSGHTRASKPDLITFASKLSGSIDLKSALPRVTDSIDLRGPGARRITVNAKSATDSGSILYDKTKHSDLTVVGLSFIDSSQEHVGSFISTDGANLKLVGDSFTHGASSVNAGAVYSYSGSLTVDDCTFAHNSSASFGGALQGGSGALKIEDSTIADNSAFAGGGGIGFFEEKATITATTITGNSVSFSDPAPFGYGGGIDLEGGKFSLQDSIVAGNTATGNTFSPSPPEAAPGRDIFLYQGATLTASYSLIQHDTTGLAGLTLNSTDITGKSADLGPLRNNGGSTDTELPSSKSPVINAGKAFGLKADQRGRRRTVNYPGVKKRHGSDGTDIGAVELQQPKKKHK
jgi:predicted outer membrane repeat protein